MRQPEELPKKGAAKHNDPDDPGNPTVNFHGEMRSNDTHESSTDADAQLARKGGKEAKLSYCGNLLIENGNGLIANTELQSPADATWRIDRPPREQTDRTANASESRLTIGTARVSKRRAFPNVR
ncbi:MAG: hypothetical protein M3Y57_18640 [Acidobacteriota bacterium]|nr:hypothetical protein [Acidobacteriota bacterium]